MEKSLEQLMEISDYLKLRMYSGKLLKMRQALERKEYLLTVMGQFSAGKSCLINNVLGKEILPVHITETTAVVTMIRYGEQEYAELVYEDGSREDISIEESLGLWQSGESGSRRFLDIKRIELYVNSELLKNGLVIADTPGVNTIIREHIEQTADIIDVAARVLYVMGKSVTDTDLDFTGKILESGVKMIFVRTHMDALKDFEENAAETVTKEKGILSEYTEDEIFFVSNDRNSKYYSEIEHLKNYLSQNLAGDIEQALCESIAESMKFIAQKIKAALMDRKQSLECTLSGNREAYVKHRTEMEASLEKMEDILQKNREKLAEKYQKTKQFAMEDLAEAETTAIKNAQRKITTLDYGTVSERYAESVKNILKTGCQNLQQTYLSYFDTMLKDNKQQLDSQLSDIGFYTQIDSDIPASLVESGEKTREISEKLAALNMLKEQLSEELRRVQSDQIQALDERETVSAEHQALKDGLENVQNELREYPEYVVQYCEEQAATHSGEDIMGKVGGLLDAAMICIPGGVWANIGAKVLTTSAEGAKLLKAAKAAEKLNEAAKTISESQKALKVLDTGVDMFRICEKTGGFGKKKKQQKLEQQQIMREQAEKARKMNKTIDNIKNGIDSVRQGEEASIFDYLSLKYYFAKIGKKFDKPQVLQIDREYEKRYQDGRHEIEERLREQAEAEFKKRQELLDITDKQEQLKLKQDITAKNQRTAVEEERELKKQLEKAEYDDKVKAIRAHYSSLAADKISEFCNVLRTEKTAEIDKNMSGYINHFDFNISANISRKRMELEELDKRYDSSEKEALKNEAAACSAYQKFLETILAENV